ncbi:hypothetical protein ASPVEDRAFT_45724 [Aspergillus versicolor CBS 583.65]|uniref:Uncharacterized protein n=1 Tax=Aspergillus versicolor CBS 583.65 TaxID=1036611 RepID=A0A1L9PXQ5_ASPVE|nr:uncharacterized protein ASPVEDRAFT_45724 [Aspergillus versicolor CBS 583.65]OJJ06330.1 hypothetical protein ASPVEDRAFT_45724 [Aspergillus versicolor CBS 583.65]
MNAPVSPSPFHTAIAFSIDSAKISPEGDSQEVGVGTFNRLSIDVKDEGGLSKSIPKRRGEKQDVTSIGHPQYPEASRVLVEIN